MTPNPDGAEEQQSEIEKIFQAPLTMKTIKFIKQKCAEAEEKLSAGFDSADSSDADEETESENGLLYPGFQDSQHADGGFGPGPEDGSDGGGDEFSFGSGAIEGQQPCYAVIVASPPPFTSKHCPPLQSGESFRAKCDCITTHNLSLCCAHGGFGLTGRCQEFLDTEMQKARRMTNNGHRNPNNIQRKKCYRKVASELDYRNRRRLPQCAVARIWQIWTDANGQYMGYRDY